MDFGEFSNQSPTPTYAAQENWRQETLTYKTFKKGEKGTKNTSLSNTLSLNTPNPPT